VIFVGECGSKDHLPWVRAELAPGRWPGEWLWEVCFYAPEDGTWNSFSAWVPDWDRDGSCFGFWRAVKKAALASEDCWLEEFDKKQGEDQ
jgi:hypothetical protein